MGFNEERLIKRKEKLLKRIETEFWIDRKGTCIKYDINDFDGNYEPCSLHHEIASELFPDYTHPETQLEILGWIKVGSVAGWNPKIVDKMPTKLQIKTLIKMDVLDHLLVMYNRNWYWYKDLI